MPHTKEQHREYVAERRIKRRLLAKQRLGDKCVHCGSTEKLEFDHIDPSTKDGDVMKSYMLDGPLERYLQEVDKCQLLCHSCHQVKTAEDVLPPHGTETRYCHRKKPCRCEECKQAMSQARKRYRSRKPMAAMV